MRESGGRASGLLQHVPAEPRRRRAPDCSRRTVRMEGIVVAMMRVLSRTTTTTIIAPSRSALHFDGMA